MAAPEQEEADAVRLKGESTVAPLAGLLTLGLAKAVEASVIKNAGTRRAVRRDFIERDTWIVNFGLAGLQMTPGTEPNLQGLNLDRAEITLSGCCPAGQTAREPNSYYRNYFGRSGGVKLDTDRIVQSSMRKSRLF